MVDAALAAAFQIIAEVASTRVAPREAGDVDELLQVTAWDLRRAKAVELNKNRFVLRHLVVSMEAGIENSKHGLLGKTS